MCMGFVLFLSERAAHHQKSSRELRSQRSYENQALLKHWCMEMVRKDSRNPAEHSWAIMTISSLCGRVWLQEQIMGRGQAARHAEPLKEWARVKRNWVAFNIALVLGSTKNNSKSLLLSPPIHNHHWWCLAFPSIADSLVSFFLPRISSSLSTKALVLLGVLLISQWVPKGINSWQSNMA